LYCQDQGLIDIRRGEFVVVNVKQLLGQDKSMLVELADGHRLQAPAAEAFLALCDDARRAGFDLSIASSYRSFDRQCLIWNGKVAGQRPIHDDAGHGLCAGDLGADELIHAIMRFSALPGTSRHHWGTDLDVYDAAVMPADYQLQLSPAEVAPSGLFDPLHCWLDEQMAADCSHGFFRPYAEDRGGVAPERWHLSYAPLATPCEAICYRPALADALQQADLALCDTVSAQLPDLLTRYVAVPAPWCPSHYRV
jgi:LAS superfamily LD-carboxypeptidase LdcB